MTAFNNINEYNEARKMQDAYHEASMQYCKENKTNGIPVDITKTFPYADVVNNDLRAKIEVWEFMQDKPNKYFLYIDDESRKATNWTGEVLGDVHFGREYRDNFGGKRQPIDVYGINGVKYHGTYFKSAGNYARIIAYKKQSSL